MSRRLFVLPSVGAGDKVLIASTTGGTPAEIVPNGSGGPIAGSILQAGSNGSLPRVLGPDDGTATLYLLRLNYRGAITGSPTTLTAVDPGTVTAVFATSSDVSAAVAGLVNGAAADRDTFGEVAGILSSLAGASTPVELNRAVFFTVDGFPYFRSSPVVPSAQPVNGGAPGINIPLGTGTVVPSWFSAVFASAVDADADFTGVYVSVIARWSRMIDDAGVVSDDPPTCQRATDPFLFDPSSGAALVFTSTAGDPTIFNTTDPSYTGLAGGTYHVSLTVQVGTEPP